MSDFQAIIYCVSLVEYAKTQLGDDSLNRMINSLKIFKQVALKFFSNSKVILLFTMTDLFVELLPIYPLENVFPEYDGGANVQLALIFLTRKFIEQCKPFEESLLLVLDANLIDQIRIPSLWYQIFNFVGGQSHLHFFARGSPRLYAFIILLQQGYLTLKPVKKSPKLKVGPLNLIEMYHWQQTQNVRKFFFFFLIQFFGMTKKLPPELLMLLCNLAFELPNPFIHSEYIFFALRAELLAK